MSKVHLSEDQLRSLCLRILDRAQVPENEARLVADSLVEANLKGLDSHGVIRLPAYIKRIEQGVTLRASRCEIVYDHGAVAVLDGHHSMGQILSDRAMRLAIEKAERFGIAAVGVRNSNHFGMASHYAEMACKAGMIGICCSNTVPLMPASGGAGKAVGNNPVSVAVPNAGNAPIVLDMALSAVALGKILVAKEAGQQIPTGWATDKNGLPTNDPAAALDGGFLLPIAQHKGYGMALIVDILSGVLTGSGFGQGVKSIYGPTETNIGHFFAAVNVPFFLEPSLFAQRIAAYVSELKASPRAPGVSEILLPGEIERRCLFKRRAEGIDLEQSLYDQLTALA